MLFAKHSPKARMGAVAKRQLQAEASGSAKHVVISGDAAGHSSLRPGNVAKPSPTTRTVAGLWIDRRKAVIVVISATGDQISEIHSAVEHEPSRFDGIQSTTTFESQLVKSDDRHQRTFTDHMSRFYHQVGTALGATHDIFLFGPGEAKGEFKKHLDTIGPADRAIAMEAVGGMSLRQIVAKVHAHFPS